MINLNDIITYGTTKFKVVKTATSEDIIHLQNNINKKMDLENDWCYIYPNNGTKANPANITANSRYVEANPFPGYIVKCTCELFFNNEWGESGWFTCSVNGDNRAMGVKAYQLNNDNIILQTGNWACLIYAMSLGGGPFGANSTGSVTNLPCRIKVWKIGKI